MNSDNRPATPLNRQLPRGLSAVLITVAVLLIFYIVGKATPTSGPQPMAGKMVEDFSGKTATGDTFRLSDQKGKVVLLNFWATWCGPCQSEIPDLIKLQEKYGPKGFTIIGISEDDNLETAGAFAKEKNFNYPVMLGTQELAKSLSVTGLPTSFLLDRSGKIVWMMEGVRGDTTTEDVIGPEIEKVL